MSVIIYQEHIEIIERENEELRREVHFLRKQLAYKGKVFEKNGRNKT